MGVGAFDPTVGWLLLRKLPLVLHEQQIQPKGQAPHSSTLSSELRIVLFITVMITPKIG